jgi:hypothetical protein
MMGSGPPTFHSLANKASSTSIISMAAEITPKKSATLAAKTDKAGDAEVEQAAERANDY